MNKFFITIMIVLSAFIGWTISCIMNTERYHKQYLEIYKYSEYYYYTEELLQEIKQHYVDFNDTILKGDKYYDYYKAKEKILK